MKATVDCNIAQHHQQQQQKSTICQNQNQCFDTIFQVIFDDINSVQNVKITTLFQSFGILITPQKSPTIHVLFLDRMIFYLRFCGIMSSVKTITPRPNSSYLIGILDSLPKNWSDLKFQTKDSSQLSFPRYLADTLSHSHLPGRLGDKYCI